MLSPAPFTTEQLAAYLTKMLKDIKDKQSLDIFLAEVAHFYYYVTVDLRMKRRGYEPYAFSQDQWNPLKVTYLISDNHSTGRALYTNLYKLFTIRVQGSTGMQLAENQIASCKENGHDSDVDAFRVLKK